MGEREREKRKRDRVDVAATKAGEESTGPSQELGLLIDGWRELRKHREL